MLTPSSPDPSHSSLDDAPVALVTGATSGIGRATAALLARQGWRVAITGRDADALGALVADLGERPLALPADLTDPASADALIGQTLDRWGQLNGLVNAAGILEAGDLASTSMEAFDRTMDINVRAVVRLCKAALDPLKRAAPRAAIVNVSSVTGLRPFPGVMAYCVSKAAIDHFTRCLAIELASEQVRVNAVNPGVVRTELHMRGGMTPDAYAAFLERSATTHPIGRVGQPDEVAALIAFLVGDSTGWITGETIAIDGGRHLTAAR